MADTLQINVAVDASGAIAPINQLKSAIAGLGAPLAAMGAASLDAAQMQQQALGQTTRAALDTARALRQMDGESVAVFKNAMQVMVDQKQLTLQQALGFDIEYTAQLHDQEVLRLDAVLDSDQATAEDRRRVMGQLAELDARYAAQSSAEFRRAADEARAQADRVARSHEEAFDRIAGSVQRTFNEVLTRQTTWAKGMTRMIQEVETYFLDEVEKMAAKWAASGLASLAGGAVASAVGAAQITAITANTTALAASTTAMTVLSTALAGASAVEGTTAGASLAGGGAV